MSPKLSPAVLLVVTLLMVCPANGQHVQQALEQSNSASMSKASLEMSQLDLSNEMRAEASARQGSSTGLASALINVLASQNAIRPDEISAGPLDAVLRPPRKENDDSGLFLQAKLLYDRATTIHSENSEVTVDPLKMRCALRINLSRLLSN